MKYQIRFTKGELNGQTFAVKQETALSIGRSHANEVKLTAPDVSGRHVLLTLTPAGVELANLSSRPTLVDDEAIPSAGTKRLVAGQVISLGNSTQFILEALTDAPAAPAPVADDDVPTGQFTPAKPAAPAAKPAAAAAMDNDVTIAPAKSATPAAKPAATVDNDATIAPAKPAVARPAAAAAKPAAPAAKPAAPAARPAPAAKPAAPAARPAPAVPATDSDDDNGANETIAMQTRMATPEELEFLKVGAQKKQTRNIILVLILIAVLIGGLAAAYRIFIYRPVEKFISWPKDANNQELSDTIKFPNCPWDGDIDLEYPAVEGKTSVKNTANGFEIETVLGKYHDVPFRLIGECFSSKDSLKKDRLEQFNEWIAVKSNEDGNWNFDPPRSIGFYQPDHGVPFLCAPYSRTVNNESYMGFAVQIRFEDWTFILLKEIPAREQWHAEAYVDKVCFLRFSERFLKQHWEGVKQQQAGTVKANLDEAKAFMLRHSPSVWPKAYLLIRSALCRILLDDSPNTEDYNKAIELLKNLRENQITYFNAQKLAYNRALRTKEVKTQNAIRENLKAVFPSEEDQRYQKIRQNKWD